MYTEDVIELATSINAAIDARTKSLHIKIECLEVEKTKLLAVCKKYVVWDKEHPTDKWYPEKHFEEMVVEIKVIVNEMEALIADTEVQE